MTNDVKQWGAQPAYPVVVDPKRNVWLGLSKREKFAMAAMQGLVLAELAK